MLSETEHLFLLKHLAQKAADVTEAGFILPAPVFFEDAADFHKTVSSLVFDTQKKIEMSEIAFLVIGIPRLQNPVRHGEPLNINFPFYLFRQYRTKRVDESISPDEFLKKIIKSAADFSKAIFNLSAEFDDEQPVAGFDEDRFLQVFTNTLQQSPIVAENERCRYIKDQSVKGFSAEFTEKVTILFREC